LKKKIIFILIVVVIFILIAIRSHNKKPNNINHKIEKDAITLSRNNLSTVNYGDVNTLVSINGDLSPVNKTIISSEVSATVNKVYVRAGDYVKQNQVLAELDKTELKGMADQIKAQLATAKAQFELNKIKLERNKELYNQGFISKVAYDELKTNYQAALEKINEQNAALKKAQKQLSNTVIKAPFAGYVYQKNVENGQLVNQNSQMFAIASLDKLQIVAYVNAMQINQVKIGQKVEFNTEASSEVYYTGYIAEINPVAQSDTRSFMVYVDYDNRKTMLKAGQFVKANIIVGTIKNALYVNSQTIRYDNITGEPFIFTIENNKVRKVIVKIIAQDDISAKVAIAAKVTVGIVVVNDLVSNINDGDVVKLL
jgi:membrane fusion protein (multidrug efflux system)